MNSTIAETSQSQYSVVEPAPHSLHQCSDVDEFRPQFEAATGCPVQDVADQVVVAGEPRAIFLVGSLPLGMATSGSDIDLIVLVDSKASLLKRDSHSANSDQRLEYSNDSDSLLAGMFVTLRNGILVDLQVAITPTIHGIQKSLRRRGRELSETEIRTLGRLSTGWLLWQSEGYLEQNAVVLSDLALGVYCCTKSFVSALIYRRKAGKSLDLDDIPLALQLGRSAVEMAYLAYFASEGLPYVGAKWLALIGRARGAEQRVSHHPLLRQGVRLLFPDGQSIAMEAAQFLWDVQAFLESMRSLIEQRMLFRIAFNACPQIVSA